MRTVFLTHKYRVKDATVGKYLDRHARACNVVWNYCCQIQREAERRQRGGAARRWPTAFDLIKLCTGSAAELGLHSDTVQTICRQFAHSRNAKRKCPRFRASRGSKRALGWVPFIDRAVRLDTAHDLFHKRARAYIVYLGRRFYYWKSRELEGELKSGCFTQDARGRWYVAFQCEVSEQLPTGNGEIGIDLGLARMATCSDGTTIPAMAHYRKCEAALGIAQRAGSKKRVRAIHAKIANTRRHHLHEQSTRIVRGNELVVVGNVNAAQLAQTRMAKSVLDAGWTMFRNQLRYKASRHGARYVEADERFTSETCSRCGTIPASSPKGLGALGIRHWVCSGCGTAHDRDVNAALNILRVGREHPPPAAEILAF